MNYGINAVTFGETYTKTFRAACAMTCNALAEPNFAIKKRKPSFWKW